MSILNRMQQTCQNVSLPNMYGFIFELSVLFNKTIISIYLTNTDDEMAKLKPNTFTVKKNNNNRKLYK